MSLSRNSLRPVHDVLHGIQVRDPYRWLENRDLPETERWIEEQRQSCQVYFSSCDSLDTLHNRVQELLNVEVVDQPARIGSRLFYRRRNPNQEQACIYVHESATGIERVLVDTSGQGQFTSFGIHHISDDASLLACEVKYGGGDTKEIRIVDVRSGRILPGSTGTGCARGFAFAPGNEGFYYCQESTFCSSDHHIMFHSFCGSAAVRPVFSRPRLPGSQLILMADGFHMGAVWTHARGSERVCDFFIAPFQRDRDWSAVFVNKRLPHSPILYAGRLFVVTYESAPNAKIIELTLNGSQVQTIVPEGRIVPRQIVIAGGRFFVNYLANCCPSVRSWTLEGKEAPGIELPVDGTIQLLPQLGSSQGSLFYAHESFAQAPWIYEYTTGVEKSSVFNRRGPSLEPSGYEVRTLSFAGKDGTAIPITLVARAGVTHRPIQPVIMTSYGGFGVSMTPQFSVLITIMMKLGAAFALPHIRGGGEFGEPWHEAGRARNRQTAIDDFIAAAEWLCTENITAPSQLGIFGGSNSGLLVGAAMTQRPGLFRAVLCIAPLLDMVRYERFDRAVKWQLEYGSVESAEDFRALYAYSPYHQVRRTVDYPAALFVSGDRDDRCNPAHVRKMAALLQKRVAQRNPILVDYSAERGHSPVLPLSVRVDALARRLAFFCKELCIDVRPEVFHEGIDS